MNYTLIAALLLAALATSSDAATFINKSGATAYVHIEYENDGVTNFWFRNNERHSVNIGNRAAWFCSTNAGRIDDCRDEGHTRRRLENHDSWTIRSGH